MLSEEGEYLMFNLSSHYGPPVWVLCNDGSPVKKIEMVSCVNIQD